MKKYVITGSLGNISRPVVEGLIKAGKEVTVITSSNNKIKEIESLKAKARVGSLFDAGFVQEAFTDAEVVYTMIPPVWETNNWNASQHEIARNYVQAISSNPTIRFIVNLSSVGVHLGKDTGPIDANAAFEKELNAFENIQVKHLRPTFFFSNFITQIPMLKNAGILGDNYGDQKIALVAPKDIAAVALEELLKLDFTGNSFRYIASDERTGHEVAEVLGKAIGKKFPWVVFTDDQLLKGLQDSGLPLTHAKAFTAMGASLREGKLLEDYEKHKPVFSKTKLEDFAQDFKKAYNA